MRENLQTDSSATDQQACLAPAFLAMERKLTEAHQKRSEDFSPLLYKLNPNTKLSSRISHVKRFLELWTADSKFRAAAHIDPQQAADDAGLLVNAAELRFLYDTEYNLRMSKIAGWKAPLIVQQYRAWCVEKILHLEKVRVQYAVPSHPQQAAWRQRQINRLQGELGQNSAKSIVHAPFALELSDGCSVNCWFCGVSAEKRKTDFAYTKENAALWQGILKTLSDITGTAADCGFCYWATDPLDNPDYEKFCLDFAEICGSFPQTTTAQSQKHFDRVRRLLLLSREHGTAINRFSVLNLRMFHKVLNEFTPEELLHTELVTQNIEATTMQSNSGKARNSKSLENKASKVQDLGEDWREVPGTIACVSGFLVNMVTRTVKLITPVPSSDRWPDGYCVYEQGTFNSTEEFETLARGMLQRHMPAMPQMDKALGFRPDLKLSWDDQSFSLKSWGLVSTYELRRGLSRITKSLQIGKLTALEIITQAEELDGLLPQEAYLFLCELFDSGLLNEEPSGDAGVSFNIDTITVAHN